LLEPTNGQPAPDHLDFFVREDGRQTSFAWATKFVVDESRSRGEPPGLICGALVECVECGANSAVVVRVSGHGGGEDWSEQVGVESAVEDGGSEPEGGDLVAMSLGSRSMNESRCP
jgi:hypothetical protein